MDFFICDVRYSKYKDFVSNFADKKLDDSYTASLYLKSLSNKDNDYTSLNIKDMNNWNGIYHLKIKTNIEEHYFTIYIEKNRLLMVSIYEGCNDFIIKEFDKDIWIRLLYEMNDINTYVYLFYLPMKHYKAGELYGKKDYVYIKEIKFM